MRKFNSQIPVEKIIKTYLDGNSSRETAAICQSNQTTVLDVLRAYNIQRRGSYRKHSFDMTYFEKIDTKGKAYFLGLMYADGNNFPEKGLVQIGMSKYDKEVLEVFKDTINYTDIIRTIIPNGQTRQNITSKSEMSLLRFTSLKLSKDLEALGVTKKKSNFIKFPNEKQVPRELLNHFIRGFFDGDGSIYTNENKRLISFSISSKSKEFLIELKKELETNCNLSNTKIYTHKVTNVSNIIYCGYYPIMRIYDYLYKDCKHFYLDRKKSKFPLNFKPLRSERNTKKEKQTTN